MHTKANLSRGNLSEGIAGSLCPEEHPSDKISRVRERENATSCSMLPLVSTVHAQVRCDPCEGKKSRMAAGKDLKIAGVCLASTESTL
jgi:Zn finger protein HypA/HybF involved in hydrogenase expression